MCVYMYAFMYTRDGLLYLLFGGCFMYISYSVSAFQLHTNSIQKNSICAKTAIQLLNE